MTSLSSRQTVPRRNIVHFDRSHRIHVNPCRSRGSIAQHGSRSAVADRSSIIRVAQLRRLPAHSEERRGAERGSYGAQRRVCKHLVLSYKVGYSRSIVVVWHSTMRMPLYHYHHQRPPPPPRQNNYYYHHYTTAKTSASARTRWWKVGAIGPFKWNWTRGTRCTGSSRIVLSRGVES